MNKNKKTILIVIAIIVVVAIIGGIVYWFKSANRNEGSVSEKGNSKLSQTYAELQSKQTFSFKTTLDNKNSTYYAKKDGAAYIDKDYQGQNSEYLIKDGNTYLLLDDRKIYYTYKNNETDLEKVLKQIETIKEQEYTEGKEKIENKEYKYEEYEGVTEFLVKNIETTDEQVAKTRFYFDNGKLVYIKTIIGTQEETLKVDISYEVDDKLFEIPEGYEEM